MSLTPLRALADWRLILASASESRLRLLRNAGCEPDVIVSDVDERAIEEAWHEPNPTELAVHLAEAKARDVATKLSEDLDQRPTLVLGADSILNVAGEPQGKPSTPERALARAQAMRGQSADLITGHCLIALTPNPPTERSISEAVATTVHFGDPTDAELAAYVASGEPLHVAGGFTLDGLSSPFIEGVTGDPSNVIGLSLPVVRRLLQHFGIAWIP